MAKVEICLGPIVGDIDLAVLIRAHRTGIDIEIRIKLTQPDPKPAGLKQRTQRGGGRPLPKEETTPPVIKINRVMESLNTQSAARLHGKCAPSPRHALHAEMREEALRMVRDRRAV